jgi:hypothetical protein
VYRREDIDTMGDAGINGQFAPKGKSPIQYGNTKAEVTANTSGIDLLT